MQYFQQNSKNYLKMMKRVLLLKLSSKSPFLYGRVLESGVRKKREEEFFFIMNFKEKVEMSTTKQSTFSYYILGE